MILCILLSGFFDERMWGFSKNLLAALTLTTRLSYIYLTQQNINLNCLEQYTCSAMDLNVSVLP